MRAIVVHTPGGPEALELEHRPVPEPPPGWVRVRIEAFGLNRSEWFTRRGESPTVSFPRVLGIECVGVVDLDPGGELRPGQQVAALMGEMGRQFDGGYQEYAVLPRRILHPFQSDLPWEVLGALPEMFQTAHGSLVQGLECQPGDTLLIRGGTTSVGMMAAQLALRMGLRVIATTRSECKLADLVAIGVHEPIIDDGALAERVRALTDGRGVDRCLELVGGATVRDSLQCVRPRGILCWTGFVSGVWAIDRFSPLRDLPHTVRLCFYGGGTEDLDDAAFAAFLDDLAADRVKVAVAGIYALDDIQEAHRHMDENRGAGKLVVRNRH
ncbi:MAG: zinc-binding dehydrogenase [Alphaproteobacteria bacterium]|nr:zinc-binding dehydrogenase [Alphaproteobacteria bacterium]